MADTVSYRRTGGFKKTAENVNRERKVSGKIQYKATSWENGGRLRTEGDPPADLAGNGFPV